VLYWLLVTKKSIDFNNAFFHFLRKGLKYVGLYVGMSLLKEFSNVTVVIDSDDAIDF
jgi:hypothetical protein